MKIIKLLLIGCWVRPRTGILLHSNGDRVFYANISPYILIQFIRIKLTKLIRLLKEEMRGDFPQKNLSPCFSLFKKIKDNNFSLLKVHLILYYPEIHKWNAI